MKVKQKEYFQLKQYISWELNTKMKSQQVTLWLHLCIQLSTDVLFQLKILFLLYLHKVMTLIILSTETVHQLRVEYKDEVTAGNGAKKDKMQGKGRLNK
jgi:SUMO ligase MMS21 Smc5/6 complex component